jgi:hypothetical protein
MNSTLKHNECLLLVAYLFITYTLNHVKIWNSSYKTTEIGINSQQYMSVMVSCLVQQTLRTHVDLQW